MEVNSKFLVYGISAGLGILVLYIFVLTVFQSYGFAIYEFKRLWMWLVPLTIGFGTQVGLYASIKHDATIKAGVTTSGTISGGSMMVCCSHYLLSIIPLIGITGLNAFTSFLMTYQKAFFFIGIVSSVMGIAFMLNHKRDMRAKCSQSFAMEKSHYEMKGGEKMEISGKVILYGILITLVLLLLLASFGVINFNFGKSTGTTGNTTSGDYSNIPEKCRPPSGESIIAWKEHLSHHADLQDCLKYLN